MNAPEPARVAGDQAGPDEQRCDTYVRTSALAGNQPPKTTHMGDDVYLDRNEHGEVVGVEVLDAREVCINGIAVSPFPGRFREVAAPPAATDKSSTASRLLGPMSRRIGHLSIALRRLADAIEQEWPMPTPPVRGAVARARKVLADNTVRAELHPGLEIREEWGAWSENPDDGAPIDNPLPLAPHETPIAGWHRVRRTVTTTPWEEVPDA